MNGYVIMCNDYPEAIVIGDEENAESKKEVLKGEDFYNKRKEKFNTGDDKIDYMNYSSQIHWHIHHVPTIIEIEIP